MQQTINTNRLQLNLLTQNDYPFIKQLVNTKGWLEFIGNRNVDTDEQAISYVNRIINTDNLFYWVINLANTNQSIGIISFLKRDYLPHFDIGFALLPQFFNNGYAFEATSKVLSIAQQFNKHQTVLASTIPHNKLSIKLLEKLGFSFLQTIVNNNELLNIYSITKNNNND